MTQTASSLLGYLTVFAICGVTALVAAGLLFLMPKLGFANVGETLVEESKSRRVEESKSRRVEESNEAVGAPSSSE